MRMRQYFAGSRVDMTHLFICTLQHRRSSVLPKSRARRRCRVIELGVRFRPFGEP